MESKEYITYSRRAKTVDKSQQSIFKNNNSHGYRSPMASTKQWVEEASQHCKRSSIEKAEQQQLYQSVGAATRGLNVTPCRIRSRKKDGRGVHFKQENDQTASSLESKVGNQASSLSPALVRKDGFPDSQAAALSPISLNVAVGGRQVVHSSANVPTKHSQISATLPKGVLQTQGQISLISPDGRVQSLPSGRDEEGRQVVWCNAAFEADDDLRSQDSARSNRFSTASCSKNVESDVSCTVTVPSLNQKQDREEWPSGISKVTGNPRAIFSSEIPSFTPAISSANALAGSSPATVMTKSPEQDSRLPHFAQLELESAAGWYTPMGSEASSHYSRSFAPGNEMPIDQSKTRKPLAATPSFKVAMPQTPSHSNRPGPGARCRSASCSKSRKYPKYFTEVPSTCEPAGRKHSNPRACISYDMGPKSAKRVGDAPVVVGKLDPRNFTPKVNRFQEDPMVEADLEADIEHEIEQEISMEILQLSERLAALHAKQETRRVGGGQERSKSGGISCPQTPLRNAPSSPCGSDTTKKRKGRVVAAKFLQYTTDGSNAKRDKSVNRTEPSAAKLLGLTDGPFLGRPNPPRRSLGTPSRLLSNGKPNGQQRNGSPNHMVKERTMGRPVDSDEQSRGNGPNKVTFEEYVRSRATLESGSRRVERVLHNQNFGDEDRKESNDRGIRQGKKKENPIAPTLCAGSAAVHPHFYPEFERKVDWVKTLRTDPLPVAHPCGTMNSSATALDERFLKQKPARQDINAWLRENIGVAEGNSEIPNFPPHTSGTGMSEGGLQGGVQADARNMMRTAEEEGSTNSRSTKPSNGWTYSLSNARTGTPNRPSTPSRGSARMIPSRYGTPVKAVRSRDPGNKCSDPKQIVENPVANPCYSQITSSKRYSNYPKGATRKASPTTRRGYPEDSAIRNGCLAVGASKGGGVGASKDERGSPSNSAEISKEERKITVVEAEYEKFVQEGVRIEKRSPEFFKNPVIHGEHRDHGANQGVRPKTPSLTRQRDLMCEPPGSATKPAKKIYIRCSDLIKDKHSMLVKGRQRRLAGQCALPSEGQDSDDSVFARSNTRTDLSEPDVNNSRSETASIIEESTYVKNCQHSQRGVGEGGQYLRDMTNLKSSEGSTPEYDIVYQYEAGRPRGSSYRPEDYTLDMMLQYVEDATLKLERENLPRIRAVKAVTAGTSSPRDSGCIKRLTEGEKRARFHFNEGGEANEVQVPKCASMDNDGLSPNEIEGLDLESFWCLVGDLEGRAKENFDLI